MLDRFMDKVSPEPNSGCWLWTSSVDSTGYGTFWKDRTAQKAHRLSYQIHRGEIPAGMQVCHKCDNPLCVNPDHLFVGTLQDNMKDRNAKGRQARGVRHSKARLSEDDVRFIRSSNLTTIALGKMFNINHGSISAIRTRKNWKHVA
jgi:hypothetical protein